MESPTTRAIKVVLGVLYQFGSEVYRLYIVVFSRRGEACKEPLLKAGHFGINPSRIA
ncbi:hypothetical protein [Porphyromonas levii]|uniref:hypothetical protein n=1 Tax=Porphyromonas levii TaxID=28114 RepID=UPI002011F394|nr:hypothetical protein [Porphyromonas levii]